MAANNIQNHYITSKQIQKYIYDRSLMPKEQKGYCRGSKGYKDQLLISKAVLQECKSRKKNKCMAWIDCQKAFDSEPHSLIIKSLQLIGINPLALELDIYSLAHHLCTM